VEADWEVEIGGDAPVIDGCWSGRVNLKETPELAAHLPEAEELPALAEALSRLNGRSSPVWTTKCDVWPVQSVDADELDAPGETAVSAVACYIDLLPATDGQWANLKQVEGDCKSACFKLHAILLRSCRVDLVVRRAVTAAEDVNLGITAYITACGATDAAASHRLGQALLAFAETIVALHDPMTDA
jgi:hypothetical protein